MNPKVITVTVTTPEQYQEAMLFLSGQGFNLTATDMPGAEGATMTGKGQHGDRPTLTSLVLKAGKVNGGCARSKLMEIAGKHGYAPSSVQSILNRLIEDKALKRVGTGIYETVARKKAA